MTYGLRHSGGVAPYNTGRSSRSAWFDGSADLLSKTFGASADANEGIYSFCVQRTGFGVDNGLVGTYGTIDGSTKELFFIFQESDVLDFYWFQSGPGIIARLITNRPFRDIGLYHIVLSYDTNQATSSDRIKLYVNGVQETSFSTETYPSLGYAAPRPFNAVPFGVGVSADTGSINTDFFNGYMAQVTFLDGVSIQQGDYAISDLVEEITYGTNGVGTSVKYDAEYEALALAAGGNSFALTSAIGDGTDSSGNGNNFTPTSMSDAANGSDNTPSLQYPIFNPLALGISTLEDGGRKVKATYSATAGTAIVSQPIPKTGKYYVEFLMAARNAMMGIWKYGDGRSYGPGYTSGDGGFSWSTDNSAVPKFTSNGTYATVAGPTLTALDVVQFAIDVDAGDFWIGVNGTWYGSGDPASGANPTVTGKDFTDGDWFWAVGDVGNNAANKATIYATESEWQYTAPTGFLAVNSANNGRKATDPQGCDHQNVVNHTGDGTSPRTITGFGFQPGLILPKGRNFGTSWDWQDEVRGANKRLISNGTDVEDSSAGSGYVSAFTSDGYTATAGGVSINNLNGNTYTYTTLGLRASGATAVNNDGTIQSTVSVSPAGHFSIISWTGNATTAQTVGHGLPGAPQFYMSKNRDDNTAWIGGSLFLTGGTYYLQISATNAQTNNSSKVEGYPTATVLQIGSDNEANGSGDGMIAYALRSVPGVLKINLRTGNGNANGPLSPADFRPKSSITKRIDSANSWIFQNAVINPFNPVKNYLQLESGSAETTSGGDVDYLPNGMKIRNSSPAWNANGGLYLDILFADIAGGGELAPSLGHALVGGTRNLNGEEPWTPADLGASLALWLDADDASTITLNGSNVAQWSDKSGNDRHATQATAANQPTYTASAYAGKPAFTFDGVNDNLEVNYNYSGDKATIYAVVSRLGGGSIEQWVFSSYGGVNGTPLVAAMWTTAPGGTLSAQHATGARYTEGGARNFIGAEVNGNSRPPELSTTDRSRRLPSVEMGPRSQPARRTSHTKPHRPRCKEQT
jgi:hypothetical protein